MQRARTFFYACAGVFLLALTYHLGARSATAQAVVLEGPSCVGNYFSASIGHVLWVVSGGGLAHITAPIPGDSPVVATSGTGLVILANGDCYLNRTFSDSRGTEGPWEFYGNLATLSTSVPGAGAASGAQTLRTPRPNPSRSSSTIDFTLPTRGRVTLTIYSVQGQAVRKLVDEVRSAGTQSVVWDGTDDHGSAVPSGMYLAVIKTSEGSESRKTVLVR
jgi:hypothetical protein